MCNMMVLSYNHMLHGIPVDCMGLGGASGIAGEHCGSRAAHPCTPPHAQHSTLAHAHPATLVEAVRAHWYAGRRGALPQAWCCVA